VFEPSASGLPAEGSTGDLLENGQIAAASVLCLDEPYGRPIPEYMATVAQFKRSRRPRPGADSDGWRLIELTFLTRQRLLAREFSG
jgi:hypothetical protein